MKHYLRCSLVKFIVIFLLYLSYYNLSANAETYIPFNLQDLQTKIDIAMHSRFNSYSVSYIGDPSTIKTDVTTIINRIYKDDYLKYTCKGYKYIATADGSIITLKFTFSYWNTVYQDNYVDTRVREIVNQIITPEMNSYEKEKRIHDWMVRNIQYDTSLVNHSDYSALVYPYKTVCQGYSLLAYKMLNAAGIQTKIIEGFSRGEAHTWNLVNLDGIWYHLDVTWDDPIPDVGSSINYNYYNLTDSQISSTHSWVKAYPVATTDFSNTIALKLTSNAANSAFYAQLFADLGLHYLTNEYTVYSSSELKSKIINAINLGQDNLEIRYTNGPSLSKDIKNTLRNVPDIVSYSYSKTDYTRTIFCDDVILKLKMNYLRYSYSEFPSNQPKLMVGSPINIID